jgi:hypothetical protein
MTKAADQGPRLDVEESIVYDMKRADRIKEVVPASEVSADAIFIALRMAEKPRRGYTKQQHPEPPPWFYDALAQFQGQILTIGRFAFLAGKMAMNKRERNALGAWLRGTGRRPSKSGGEQVFTI